MSKVYENGIIRDATSDEENMISQNGGGGLSESYELIKEVTISEPIGSISITTDDKGNPLAYDDIVVVCQLKGTNNAQFKFNANTNRSSSIYFTRTSALSDTAFRSFYLTFTRNTESLWTCMLAGQFTQYQMFEMPDNPTYDNKINKLTIYPDAPNSFTEGTVKVYGRKRI